MLRNIGFSFNMIKKYYEIGTPEIYSNLFAEAENRILRQIQNLNKSLKKLKLHNEMFIRTLKFSDEITESSPPFDKIFRVNIENFPKYLTDPSDCLSLLNIEGEKITEGKRHYLTYHTKSEGELLWRKNNLAKYFHFMLSDIYMRDLYKSKAEENIKKIAKAGFSAKYLILKYIFTLNHPQADKNNFVNYFDAWIEAYPNN